MDKADQFKPLNLSITEIEGTLSPSDFAEEHRLEEVRITWAGGNEYKWNSDSPQTWKGEMDLFGDEASGFAAIVIIPSEKGNKKNPWKKMDPQKIGPVKGPWAPIRLLAQGLEEGSPAGGSDLTLRYKVKVPYGKKEGTVIVTIHAKAAGLGTILRLAEKGLEPPPARLED